MRGVQRGVHADVGAHARRIGRAVIHGVLPLQGAAGQFYRIPTGVSLAVRSISWTNPFE